LVKKRAARKASGGVSSSGRLAPDRSRKKKEIKVALLGVGNVASALLQAIYAGELKGVWHEIIGGYKRSDIKIVAAFDIDTRKVGKDLADVIHSPPNVTPEFCKINSVTGIVVQPGVVNKDEVPNHLAGQVTGSQNFSDLLELSDSDIALNLLPSGMAKTSADYAKACLGAGVSLVNATPEKIANDAKIARAYQKAKRVVVGDDLMSQFGGTAFHKGILDFMNSRGLRVAKSYQLDVGGGAETLNTINERVKFEKRDIKTEAIAEELPYKFETIAGTTDYVDYMGNNRTSYFWIQARSLFDSEVKIDVYLRTNDAANAGNILLDVVRAAARAKDTGDYGAPRAICDYGFKKLSKPALLRSAHDNFFKTYG
jgi:myo-inositol-1-phosphate synthase